MYNNIVLNLFNNPKNAGRISKPDGIADCYNVDETSHVEFSLRIENGVIIESKFRAQANPYIVAVCSTITQMLKGKLISMVFLDPYEIKNELGEEAPVDINFCIECVKMAIDDYREKTEKPKKQKKKDQDQEQEGSEPIEEVELMENNEEKVIEDNNISETNSSLIDDDFSDFFDDLFDEDI